MPSEESFLYNFSASLKRTRTTFVRALFLGRWAQPLRMPGPAAAVAQDLGGSQDLHWRQQGASGQHANVDRRTDNKAAARATNSQWACAQCIVWKMRRAPVKSLVDATLAPPGKKWSYDTLTLKVKTATGNLR
eukprot:scaffold139570_cov130-Phaeocystis_antarctica.AAC.1